MGIHGIFLSQYLLDAYEKAAVGHMTEWEQEREKEEFDKAAKFYKPMTSMMASRFTRAKYHDDETVKLPVKEEVTLFLKNGEFCTSNLMLFATCL